MRIVFILAVLVGINSQTHTVDMRSFQNFSTQIVLEISSLMRR